MKKITKVYVVTDQDKQILGVATDLAFVTRIILDEFEKEACLELTSDETAFGYIIKVKEDGIKYTYYADVERLRGVM